MDEIKGLIETTSDADEYPAGVKGVILGFDEAAQHDGTSLVLYEILMEDGDIVRMASREFTLLDGDYVPHDAERPQ